MNTLQSSDNNPSKSLQSILDKELLRLEMISLVDYQTEETEQEPEAVQETAEAQEPAADELLLAESAEQPQTVSDSEGTVPPSFANVKSLEELLASDSLAASVKAEINLLRADTAVSAVEVIKKSLAMFNIIDELRLSAEQENASLHKQIKSAVSQSLALLREMGVHEVDVYGQFIDEEYMELLGTVPAAEAPKGLQTFQVAAVCRRAFSFEETGKIIQYALVKTVS